MGSFITSGDLLQDRAVTVPHRLTSGEIAANLIKGCKLIVHSALGGCEAAGQSAGRGIANNNKLIKQNNSDGWQGSLSPLQAQEGPLGCFGAHMLCSRHPGTACPYPTSSGEAQGLSGQPRS